ncbi:MAG: insulinase family protein [Syntrophobacterales bacterium]|jgi:zinc protease|nr:insulinase family protein [Syntrophobacterales bacterium]
MSTFWVVIRLAKRQRGACLNCKLTAILLLAVALACAPKEPQPQVLRATLDNGLRVVIVPNRIAPVATTMVNYLVGSNEAPPGFPGTAHAQEHMMFRGNPGLSANQLAAITAAMGGRFDADTQQAVTQYFFTVPSADLQVALHIEAIRMRGVLDREKLWTQERGAIEQEVGRDLSDPEFVFYTKLLADMFKGTPYAHSPLGTDASFDRTTGARLKKFYDTWYAPNNAILVVVGDVDPQKTLGEIKKRFGSIPKKQLPPRAPIKLSPVTPETISLNTDQPMGMVMVAFRLPGYDSPDYAASKVLADVLGSQRYNLYGLAAGGKALAADFALDTLPQAGLGYAVAAFPQGGNAQALLTEVKAVLAETVKNGVLADLVAAAKKQAKAEGEFQKNSVSGLAMAWSQALAVEGRQSPEDDVKAIDQVTPADVDRVARQYLDLDKAVVGILTPEVSGKPVVHKGFGGPESFQMQPTKQVTLPEWATSALQRLAIPPSTVHPAVSTLPNGIKLIVQPESVSDTVGVYGHIKNQPDLQVPPGQEGVDRVLDQLFSYGTATLDRLAFQKALDDIAAQAAAGNSFELKVLSEHFERGVQLLAENELHPALPEEAFKIVRTQVAAAVAGRLQSPDYLASRALKAALYPENDPTLRQPTPASVSALTLADVRDYFGKVFRPDLTTIVVIGKVTPEQAQKAIAMYFGHWQATGPTPDTLLPPVPPNGPSTVAVPDASRVQDKVTLAQTLGLTRGNPDYYALVLGNHVLGGGFYATRLYQQLREETGLVYYVGVTVEANQTRAAYAIDYGCNPGNVAKAQGIVVRNLAAMQTQPVAADELHQAKAMLLREIPLSESSLTSIAQGLLSRSILDLPLDEPTLAAQHYMAMTADQVKAAFAKWVRPPDLVQVTQGPTPQ